MTTLSAKTVDTDNARVSYAVTGEGDPLVLLHSLLTDRRVFDRVIPLLDNRVVALDLPGFGNSESVDPTIEAYAGAMTAATERICAEAPLPVVMGNGLGAFVALGMAVRNPDSMRRLIVVGCGATFPEPLRPAFSKMIELVEDGGMAAVTPTALRRIYTEDYLEDHPEEAKVRAEVLSKTDPRAFVTACRALESVDFSEAARVMTVPTLIVVGEEDQATPPEMASQLDAILPNSRLVTMPGVAHAPQLQDPTGFFEVVEPFLEEA